MPLLGLPKLLGNSGQCGHPCLVPDLRMNAFSFSPLIIIFSVGLLYMACFRFKYVASEEGMATHSSILAWRIPWTEEPGRLQTIVLQRVRHDYSDL